MSSQLVIFIAFFFRPHNSKSEKKNPVNQLIKNSGLNILIDLINFQKTGIFKLSLTGTIHMTSENYAVRIEVKVNDFSHG